VELEALVCAASSHWKIPRHDIVLAYEDTEGDIITLSSGGVAEALAHHAGAVLRLSVSMKGVLGRVFFWTGSFCVAL
jgi:hypothetical protein